MRYCAGARRHKKSHRRYAGDGFLFNKAPDFNPALPGYTVTVASSACAGVRE
jgi:hypothetical protein